MLVLELQKKKFMKNISQWQLLALYLSTNSCAMISKHFFFCILRTSLVILLSKALVILSFLILFDQFQFFFYTNSFQNCLFFYHAEFFLFFFTYFKLMYI